AETRMVQHRKGRLSGPDHEVHSRHAEEAWIQRRIRGVAGRPYVDQLAKLLARIRPKAVPVRCAQSINTNSLEFRSSLHAFGRPYFVAYPQTELKSCTVGFLPNASRYASSICVVIEGVAFRSLAAKCSD